MKNSEIKDSVYNSIIGFYENNLTKEQADQLITWISEDKNNLYYFRETGRLWLASGMLRQKKFDLESAWIELQERIKQSGRKHYPGKIISIKLTSLVRYAAAVMILLTAGAASLFIFRNSGKRSEVSFIEAVAPKGSRSIITLADGSSIWLNSDTKIRYKPDFGTTSRELYLEGEAFFVVAENKALPFRVNTSDISITALGTSFNVKAYNDENVIETTLEKGEIRIDQVGLKERQLISDPVFLKPNQKAVFTRDNLKISVNEKENDRIKPEQLKSVHLMPAPIIIDTLVDTKLSTSWKDSRWIFRKEQLIRLKPILERRYDITLVFKDSSLCSYKFTGTIKEESLDQVLKAVSLAAPIKYNIEQNIVTLSENSDQRSRFQRIQKSLN